MVEDFWKPAVKVICDSKFVDTLIAFDMDDVAVRTLRLLEERIFHHEEADAAKIRNYSAAAEGNNSGDAPRLLRRLFFTLTRIFARFENENLNE